ncbi:MAG: ribosomal protein S18-alanine N-acetyltransferase [Coprococcus sp.]
MMIRPMEEKDILQVLDIEEESFGDPWSEQAFRDSLKQSEARFLIAQDSVLGIIGYCCSYRALDEAEIVNVAVRSDCRNRGIGNCLVEQMIQEDVSDGVRYFILEVRKSNFAAQHVYGKLGFVEVGIRKNFYDRPVEDAVIMRKEIITADE